MLIVLYMCLTFLGGRGVGLNVIVFYYKKVIQTVGFILPGSVTDLKCCVFLEERSIPPHKKENSEPNSILKLSFPRFLANFLITSHHY